ncbi:MAG: hypothetical protein ACRCYL_04985, partial [Kluyvera sp.]
MQILWRAVRVDHCLLYARVTEHPCVEAARAAADEGEFDFYIAAPRSPVNHCGLPTSGTTTDMTPTPSEQAAAVLNII